MADFNSDFSSDFDIPTGVGGGAIVYGRPKYKSSSPGTFNVEANFNLETQLMAPLTLSYLEVGETSVEMLGRQYQLGTIQVYAVFGLDKTVRRNDEHLYKLRKHKTK